MLNAFFIFFFNHLVTPVQISESIRLHNLRNANTVLGTHKAMPDVIKSTASNIITTVPTTIASFRNFFHTTSSTAATTLSRFAATLRTTPSTPCKFVFMCHCVYNVYNLISLSH